MGRDGQRNTENLLNQATRKVGIPGMTMNDIRLFDRPCHEDVPEKGIQ
jgi:hypothetical protein